MRLRDVYKAKPGTKRDYDLQKLVNYLMEATGPSEQGRVILRDIQISYAQMKGKDPDQFRAKLEKADYGSNPFIAAIASSARAVADKPGRQGSGNYYKGSNNTNNSSQKQWGSQGAQHTAWGPPHCNKCNKKGHKTENCEKDATCAKCGKVGHTLARCWGS